MTLLKDGSRGEEVRRLQSDLGAVGLDPGPADGIFGQRTTAAVVAFQAANGLGADGIVGPLTRSALDRVLASGGGGGGGAPHALPTAAHDWRADSLDDRRVHVVARLVDTYGYSAEAAAGIVGNLESESGIVPYSVEGDRGRFLEAGGWDGAVHRYTPEDVRDRDRATSRGPRLPGVGLEQWTSPARRAGLFAHTFGGVTGVDMLFDMDAQVDYLVSELRADYAGVEALLTRPGVSVEDAADEVVYGVERPGRILTPVDEDGHRSRRPRTDPQVQDVFRARRANADAALAAYRASP